MDRSGTAALLGAGAATVCGAVLISRTCGSSGGGGSGGAAIVPIEDATEHFLELGGGLRLWYRTWGRADGGVPVLFVHGGPGNCVADYANVNARFFDADKFFVVEVCGVPRPRPLPPSFLPAAS
eukprot:COSAG01_NODE_23433_length_815_cov_1.328212_2_plen_124_part_00